MGLVYVCPRLFFIVCLFLALSPLGLSDSSSSVLCSTNVFLVFQVVVRDRFSCLTLLSSTAIQLRSCVECF